MGAGRKTVTYAYDSVGNPNFRQGHALHRGLPPAQLTGVIFGCTSGTYRECVDSGLFGLPQNHWVYVQHITPGMPLFLFNYTDKKLHGIFEAASEGELDIDPHAWTGPGRYRGETTRFPAQVKVRLRRACSPIPESAFREVISANYYNDRHFQFELDERQTDALLALFLGIRPWRPPAAPHAAARGSTGAAPLQPPAKPNAWMTAPAEQTRIRPTGQEQQQQQQQQGRSPPPPRPSQFAPPTRREAPPPSEPQWRWPKVGGGALKSSATLPSGSAPPAGSSSGAGAFHVLMDGVDGEGGSHEDDASGGEGAGGEMAQEAGAGDKRKNREEDEPEDRAKERERAEEGTSKEGDGKHCGDEGVEVDAEVEEGEEGEEMAEEEKGGGAQKVEGQMEGKGGGAAEATTGGTSAAALSTAAAVESTALDGGATTANRSAFDGSAPPGTALEGAPSSAPVEAPSPRTEGGDGASGGPSSEDAAKGASGQGGEVIDSRLSKGAHEGGDPKASALLVTLYPFLAKEGTSAQVPPVTKAQLSDSAEPRAAPAGTPDSGGPTNQGQSREHPAAPNANGVPAAGHADSREGHGASAETRPAGAGSASAPQAGEPNAGAPDSGAPSAEGPSAGAPSAGVPDAGAPSAGVPDAGAPSAGEPDAGAPSAGVPDAGAPSPGGLNAGALSFGGPSGGVPSAGVPITGVPEAGGPSAGVASVGVPNAGVPNAGAPSIGGPSAAVPDFGVPSSAVPNVGMPSGGVYGGAPPGSGALQLVLDHASFAQHLQDMAYWMYDQNCKMHHELLATRQLLQQEKHERLLESQQLLRRIEALERRLPH